MSSRIKNFTEDQNAERILLLSKQAGSQTNKQINKQENKQTRKQTNRRTYKQTKEHTNKQENIQTNRRTYKQTNMRPCEHSLTFTTPPTYPALSVGTSRTTSSTLRVTTLAGKYAKTMTITQFTTAGLPRCVVWCGVVWCGVVWCGVVWCGVV